MKIDQEQVVSTIKIRENTLDKFCKSCQGNTNSY